MKFNIYIFFLRSFINFIFFLLLYYPSIYLIGLGGLPIFILYLIKNLFISVLCIILQKGEITEKQVIIYHVIPFFPVNFFFNFFHIQTTTGHILSLLPNDEVVQGTRENRYQFNNLANQKYDLLKSLLQNGQITLIDIHIKYFEAVRMIEERRGAELQFSHFCAIKYVCKDHFQNIEIRGIMRGWSNGERFRSQNGAPTGWVLGGLEREDALKELRNVSSRLVQHGSAAETLIEFSRNARKN